LATRKAPPTVSALMGIWVEESDIDLLCDLDRIVDFYVFGEMSTLTL
jgi:hypothetical protein